MRRATSRSQIGRQWKVGTKGNPGDPARNTGVIILVVPKESSADGRGHIAISTGYGAEGFITDGTAGAIRDEAIPQLRARDYGGAILLMTTRVAERYAAEYHFALDSAAVSPPPMRAREGRPRGGSPPLLLVIAFVVFIIILRAIAGRGRRRGCGGGPMIFVGGGGRAAAAGAAAEAADSVASVAVGDSAVAARAGVGDHGEDDH